MSSDAIVFKSVSKVYSKYAGFMRVRSLAHRLRKGRFMRVPADNMRLTAIDNISFSVALCERVGIIGANGAGKSTLLRLISGVTAPTSGEIVVEGKVGGLIEMGAGFHPELTGRENIYLGGAVLGFGRRKVERLVRPILSISGLEEFVDVPLKWYSSGMRVKLGYALAIASRPDIVLLDETTAVGDRNFKARSSRMTRKFVRNRTLIMVSHSLEQVQKLCSRVVVLDRGKAAYDGNVENGIRFYEDMMDGREESGRVAVASSRDADQASGPSLELGEICLSDEAGSERTEFSPGSRVIMSIPILGNYPVDAVFLIVHIRKSVGAGFSEMIDQGKTRIRRAHCTAGRLSATFETRDLRQGTYSVSARVTAGPGKTEDGPVVMRKRFTIVSVEAKGQGLVNLRISFE